MRKVEAKLGLIYALAALPLLRMLGGIIFANRVEPFVLGMPFVLF